MKIFVRCGGKITLKEGKDEKGNLFFWSDRVVCRFS